MGRPSEHFSTAEIACKCGCGQALVHPPLYAMLERFRAFIAVQVGQETPLSTHCVNRCRTHNAAVGGEATSWHLTGHAWDGAALGLTVQRLHEIVRNARDAGILTGGVGWYSWGVHLDAESKREWWG